MLRFDHHRQRVEQHEARQMGRRASQRAAAELGKDVFLRRGAWRHHAMSGLRAAVVAHHGVRVVAPRQVIHDRAFARIAKAEIHGQNRLLHDEPS